MYEHFETGVLHEVHQKNPHGALCTPIYQSSTFVFDDCRQGADRFLGEEEGFIYTRLGNPTTRLLERKVAAMEKTEDCVVFSSGMGAISGTLLTFLSQGDHVLSDPVLYGCTFSLFTHVMPRFGITADFCDFQDLSALSRAMTPKTRVVYLETPANPTLKIIDIQAVCETVRQVNPDCLVVVDNTFATPYLTNPILLGASLVVHSATKYINGHGDVVAGMAAGPAELVNQVRSVGQKDITGSVISPNDAYLLLRGIKTLKCRMDAHCKSASLVAAFLKAHPAVDKLYYPGDRNHRGHAVARRQMAQYGGLIAFEVKGGYEGAVRMLDALNLCSLAVSLGDAETLIQHPASMTHSTYTKAERAQAGIGEGLIRLSVGLENAQDIIDDLKIGLDLLV